MNAHARPRPPYANTAMSAAFLRALGRWAQRHAGTSEKITLPTGTAAANELVIVLRSLGLLDRKPS